MSGWRGHLVHKNDRIKMLMTYFPFLKTILKRSLEETKFQELDPSIKITNALPMRLELSNKIQNVHLQGILNFVTTQFCNPWLHTYIDF